MSSLSRPTHAEACRFFADQIIKPFTESSLYGDYQEADGWTDEEFSAYLVALLKSGCECCPSDICDECRNPFAVAGDGYDGLCPPCADRAGATKEYVCLRCGKDNSSGVICRECT